jgi:RNA polymerase sigma-70 factor (ECF subfamily)
MSERPSDAHLLHLMASRNAAALSVLYDRHHRLVFAVAMRMLRRKDDAEDVLQDVFLHAWKDASRFDAARGGVEAWLGVMTRSRALDKLRRRRRLADPLVDTPDGSPSSEAALLQSETQARLDRAVAALTSSHRLALELAFYEELTHAQVAALLGQPLGTIKTRVRRALMRVRDALAAGAVAPPLTNSSPFVVSLTGYFARVNGSAAVRPLRGINVLLVDNNAEARELVRAVLEGAGAHVTEGRSVADALQVLKNHWPHVLVADPVMPDEDGLELVRHAAAMADATGRPRPVAAAFTTGNGKIPPQRALAAGFAAYVAKPVQPQELVTAVVRLTTTSPEETSPT